MTTHKGLVIELKRLDTALTKAELIEHIEREHSRVPFENPGRLRKDTILSVHRLVHLRTDR